MKIITLMQSTICAVPLLAAAAYFPAQAAEQPGQGSNSRIRRACCAGRSRGSGGRYVAGLYGSDTPRCEHRSAHDG